MSDPMVELQRWLGRARALANDHADAGVVRFQWKLAFRCALRMLVQLSLLEELAGTVAPGTAQEDLLDSLEALEAKGEGNPVRFAAGRDVASPGAGAPVFPNQWVAIGRDLDGRLRSSGPNRACFPQRTVVAEAIGAVAPEVAGTGGGLQVRLEDLALALAGLLRCLGGRERPAPVFPRGLVPELVRRSGPVSGRAAETVPLLRALEAELEGEAELQGRLRLLLGAGRRIIWLGRFLEAFPAEAELPAPPDLAGGGGDASKTGQDTLWRSAVESRLRSLILADEGEGALWAFGDISWALRDFVPLADLILDRAESAGEGGDALSQGNWPGRAELARRVLDAAGLAPVEVRKGRTLFDPAVHHGVSYADWGFPDGVVAGVVRRGYAERATGQVIRPPEVLVSRVRAT